MFTLDPRHDTREGAKSLSNANGPRRYTRRAGQNQQRRASALELCRRHRRGGSKFATLLVLGGMTAGGVYAYRRFFQRSGEAAIQLIPVDAQMLVTLDLTPSAGQALTFKRIGDAIKAEHLDTRIDDLMTKNLSNSPLARDLRPFATGSTAYARLKATGGAGHAGTMDGDSVFFMAVKDVGQTSEILARDAQKSNINGLDYYKITGDTHCMAVIGSYLVTADKPQDLTRIEEVRKGELPAISTLPDYKTARAGLAADSNLMLFISGDAIAQGMRQGMEAAGQHGLAAHNPSAHARYIAVGMAVRDGGIDAVAEIPIDPPAGAEGDSLSHIAPLDPNIWRKLPSGAYGLIAIAQPGKYYSFVTAMTNSDADARRQMAEGVASFERETGLSVTRDILTGLNGNAVMAVYPDADNPRSSVDGLIVLDDANGADPAALSDRVRGYAERASGQSGGHPLHFTSENRNGVIIWTLDQTAQQDLQHSLAGGVSEAQRTSGMSGDTGAGANSSAPDDTNIGNGNIGRGNVGNGNIGNGNIGDGNVGDGNIGNNDGGNGNNDGGDVSGSHDNSNNGTGNAGDVSGNSGNGNGNTGSNSGNGNGNQIHVDAHIHGDNGGRVFDDSFALHHGDTDAHVDNNGVDVHSGGNHLSAGNNGLDVHVENNTGHAPANTGHSPTDLLPPGDPRLGNFTAPPAVNPDVQRAIGNKTITWAQVGHAVILATSPHMLNRALAAYTNGSNTLADDAGFAATRQRIPQGAQCVNMLNLPSILEALRPLIARALRGNQMGLTAADITGLAGGLGNSAVATQQYDGKTMRATYFLPLDYERAIHLAGALQRGR